MLRGADFGSCLLSADFFLAMLIGRVIGDIVATQKAPSHEGRKILVVQPLNLDGSSRGDEVLALDAVDAGALCVPLR